MIKFGQKEGNKMEPRFVEEGCSAIAEWYCLLGTALLALLTIAHLPFMLGCFLWEALEKDRWWGLFGVVPVALIVCTILWKAWEVERGMAR